MAELTGVIQLEGKLGNLSFFKRNGKYIARRKGGPSSNMWHNHECFALSRNNSAEFGSASTVAGKIRKLFAQRSEYHGEGTCFNRLMGLVHEIAKYDPESMRGQRSLFNSNVYLLEDFQWNKKLSFAHALQTENGYYMDAVTGKVQVQFSSFVPATAVKAPAGASHFQIVVKAGMVYEKEPPTIAAMKVSEVMRLHGNETGTIELELDVELQDKAGEGLMLLGGGILFYEEVEGVLLAMRGGAFGLMCVEPTEAYEALVKVDEETGELVDRTEEIKQEREARRVKRGAALKYQAEFIAEFGYRMVKELLPVIDDPVKMLEMEKARKELDRKMWLRKLERYRGARS